MSISPATKAFWAKTLTTAYFAGVNLLYATMFGGPIDGTAWDVTLRPQGIIRWTTRTETLLFSDGRAVVVGALVRGYPSAVYESRDEGSGTAFSVRLEGDGRDPVEWSGRVQDGRIAGTVVVRRRGGRAARYVFSGTRKTG